MLQHQYLLCMQQHKAIYLLECAIFAGCVRDAGNFKYTLESAVRCSLHSDPHLRFYVLHKLDQEHSIPSYTTLWRGRLLLGAAVNLFFQAETDTAGMVHWATFDYSPLMGRDWQNYGVQSMNAGDLIPGLQWVKQLWRKEVAEERATGALS